MNEGLGPQGDDLRERRLACPWRSPEDHRRSIIVLNRYTQGLAGAEQMLLSYILFECARPHSFGQRSLPGGQRRSRKRGGVEQTHRFAPVGRRRSGPGIRGPVTGCSFSILAFERCRDAS